MPQGDAQRTAGTIDWDGQPLGKETDRVIAARLGVSFKTVGKRRKSRGIPRYKRIDWDDQPLGELYDREIAQMLEVTASIVGTERRKRGIPVLRQPKPMLNRLSVLRNSETGFGFVKINLQDFPYVNVGDTVRVVRDYNTGTVTIHVFDDA